MASRHSLGTPDEATAMTTAAWVKSLTGDRLSNYLVLVVSCSPRSPAVTAFVERLCEAAGVILISKATADAIDDAHRRMKLGLPVSGDEISRIEYAVAACSPDGALPFNPAGDEANRRGPPANCLIEAGVSMFDPDPMAALDGAKARSKQSPL